MRLLHLEMEQISVAIRVRPPIKPEIIRGSSWKFGDKTITLHNALGFPVGGQSYTFDQVFSKDASNASIYELHAKHVILSALEGFNSTVFAYGQTSSGKTYTMRGSEQDAGIIHRAVCDVFCNTVNRRDREFLIRVSYMEIYKEEINDLLAPENRKLRIHENSERGIIVAGLREEIVDSPEKVFEFLNYGEANRHVGKTNMNVYSSRSHTIFRMVIESRDKTKMNADDVLDAVRVSTLNMVDLAGSERISKTGAGGVRLKEGTHINKSLMTLGTVINKLSEATGKQSAHIPYRDSKLTRILQSALDGNAKTAVICTVTPDEMQLDETRGTLQFASRAKKVSTCPQVNETITDAALLKRQKKEIEVLRQKLQGTRSEVLEKEILNLRNDLLKFELERERLTLELEEEKKAQKERESRIQEQERKIESLSTLVISSAWDDRKPSRKSNRRETWCPQWESPKTAVKLQDRSDSESRSMVSARGDTDTTPIKFQTLLEHDYGPSDMILEDDSQAEVISLPSDFENIADEETWNSMNRGIAGFDTSRSMSSGSTSDIDITKDSEADLLRSKFEDLKSTLVSKEEELEQTKVQLRAAVQEKEEILHQELQFRQKLEASLEDLEQDVLSGKRVIDGLQNVLEGCRTSVKFSVQHFKTAANTLIDDKAALVNWRKQEHLKLLAAQEQAKSRESSESSRFEGEHKYRGSGKKAAVISRLVELEETERHLKQLLQHSMEQLLEYQGLNINLSTENASLVRVNAGLQLKLDAVSSSAVKPPDDDPKMRQKQRILAFILYMQANRVKKLETELAGAKLEIVELKVDAEVTGDAGRSEESKEMLMLRRQFDLYQEEMRLIMQQVPTAEDEAKFNTALQENRSLRKELEKARQRAKRCKSFLSSDKIQHLMHSIDEDLNERAPVDICESDHFQSFCRKFTELKFQLVKQKFALIQELDSWTSPDACCSEKKLPYACDPPGKQQQLRPETRAALSVCNNNTSSKRARVRAPQAKKIYMDDANKENILLI